MSRNEAAERLRARLGYTTGDRELLDAALATERRLTVERVRVAVKAARQSSRAWSLDTILDDLANIADGRGPAPQMADAAIAADDQMVREAQAAAPEQDEAVRLLREAADQVHSLLRQGFQNRSWHDVGLARQHVKTLRWLLQHRLASPPPVPATEEGR